MKKIFINILLVGATLFASSCKDALDEKSYSFITPEELGDYASAVDQYIIGAYNILSSGDFFRYGSYLYLTNMDCDYATGADWAFGSVGAGNPTEFWGMENMWNGSYSLIHRANRGIFMIKELKNITTREKEHAIAELSFLKAWAYFNLVRNYGAVPIHKVSISEGSDYNQPRQDIPVVYNHIIELLLEAEKMYSIKDAKYSKGRASSGAAKSLLSKVYVTMASAALPAGEIVDVKGGRARVQQGDEWIAIKDPQVISIEKQQVAGYESLNAMELYAKARDKAYEVIQSGDYYLLPFDEIWKPGNRNTGEHIWSLQALQNHDLFGNSICQDYVGIFRSDGSVEGNWYGMSDHWYSLFEKEDLRILDGVVHRWAPDRAVNGVLQYAYYPAIDEDKVLNQEAYDSKGNKYDGTETYLKAPGWSCAKLTKFAGVTDRTSVKTDFHFPFLRYPDVLLIYAEAVNELEAMPTIEAYKMLNDVRVRSRASVLSGLTKVQFRSAVLEERARELAYEADRRYDLFRWGIYLKTMNAIDIDLHGILKRRTTRNLLYPIPVKEIDANSAIDLNNPGW